LVCSTDDNGNETLKPCDLFSHAKSLARCVVEDESIQSIQALLLMVLLLFHLTVGFVSCKHRSPQSWVDFSRGRNSDGAGLGSA
jgi:hypothetical protein